MNVFIYTIGTIKVFNIMDPSTLENLSSEGRRLTIFALRRQHESPATARYSLLTQRRYRYVCSLRQTAHFYN